MLKSCLNQISVNYQTIKSDTAIGIGVYVELSLKTNYLVPSDLPADIIYKSVYIFNFFGLLPIEVTIVDQLTPSLASPLLQQPSAHPPL